MGLGRSSVLRIGSNPAEASSSGRTDGGNDSLAVVVHRAAPGEPPLGWGSKYLRAAVQNAKALGPNRVEPLYIEIFAARYVLVIVL